jgi:hypothetical protein
MRSTYWRERGAFLLVLRRQDHLIPPGRGVWQVGRLHVNAGRQ